MSVLEQGASQNSEIASATGTSQNCGKLPEFITLAIGATIARWPADFDKVVHAAILGLKSPLEVRL